MYFLKEIPEKNNESHKCTYKKEKNTFFEETNKK